MARMQIHADARWLGHAVRNVLLFLVLLFVGVYLFAGLWWTLAAGLVLVLLVVLIWKVLR